MDTHADLDALPYGTKIKFHSASKGKKSAFAHLRAFWAFREIGRGLPHVHMLIEVTHSPEHAAILNCHLVRNVSVLPAFELRASRCSVGFRADSGG